LIGVKFEELGSLNVVDEARPVTRQSQLGLWRERSIVVEDEEHENDCKTSDLEEGRSFIVIIRKNT
jgi:hypothetical protein